MNDALENTSVPFKVLCGLYWLFYFGIFNLQKNKIFYASLYQTSQNLNRLIQLSISKSGRPALILIDIQKGFDNIEYWGGERNNPGAEIKAGELLKIWRVNNLPIYHIKHCSSIPTSLLHEANSGNEFKDLVFPMEGEPIIKKNVNSAFIGTNLKEHLDKANITKLVIVGLTTDHCVSTTTRMAGNLGYETYLVSDATATFNKKGIDGQNYSAELIHETALASLNEEFATVVTTDFIIQNI